MYTPCALVQIGCLCDHLFCLSPAYLHQSKGKFHPHEMSLLTVPDNLSCTPLIYAFLLFYVNELIQHMTFWGSSLSFAICFIAHLSNIMYQFILSRLEAIPMCGLPHSVCPLALSSLVQQALSLFHKRYSYEYLCFNGCHKRYSCEYLCTHFTWTLVFNSLRAPIYPTMEFYIQNLWSHQAIFSAPGALAKALSLIPAPTLNDPKWPCQVSHSYP